MRPPHHPARRQFADGLVSDGQAQRSQPVRDTTVAGNATFAHGGQPGLNRLQAGGIAGQPQAQHMDLAPAETGADFTAAYDLHAQGTPGRLGLVQPGQSIVIRNGHGGQTQSGRPSHQPGRTVRSVRSLGVRM